MDPDPTIQNEADVLVEQQHQLREDLQAELAEAVERSQALDKRCCRLEEQLLRVSKEAELECLRALEALRSKSEARERSSCGTSSRPAAKDAGNAVAATAAAKPRQCRGPLRFPRLRATETTTESAEPVSGDVTSGQSKIVVTSVAEPTKRDLIKSSQAIHSAAAQTNQASKNSLPAAGKASEQKLAHQKAAVSGTEAGLASALLAQQLPPLPKFSGELSQEEPFKEWIAQFELMAEVCNWSKRAQLIHLTTRLQGEAFTFYKFCSPLQKADYDLLVAELTQFTPVRI